MVNKRQIKDTLNFLGLRDEDSLAYAITLIGSLVLVLVFLNLVTLYLLIKIASLCT